MKLQQLKYLIAIVDNGLNITSASEALFTSQPGVSKQIRLLEDELSLKLFVRKGKSLAALTDAGEAVVRRARRVLAETDNIKQISRELAETHTGNLTIATTATQARYVLPDMLESFQKKYPGIALRLNQGTSSQIAEQVLGREADFAIASGESVLFEDLVTIPLYRWERVIIVPRDHELAQTEKPDLADFAQYPIISYTNSFSDESSLARAFESQGVKPNVVFTASDPDTIKTYVRKNMGIGIIASMALDAERDSDLVAIPATGLFPIQTTWVGFRKDSFLREYMYDFLQQVAPEASRESIDQQAAVVGKGTNVVPIGGVRSVERHPTFGSQFKVCGGV